MCPCSKGGQGHPGLCWLFLYLVRSGGNDLSPLCGMCEILCPVWGFPVHIANSTPYEWRLEQLGLLILEKFSEESIFCLQLPSKREEKPNSFQMSTGIGQEANDTVRNTWKYKNSWCETLVFDWTWGWSNTGRGYPVNLWDVCPWSCSRLNGTLFCTTWFE